MGLRLMAASGRFWHNHAYTREGYTILIRLLDLKPSGPTSDSYTKARGAGFNLASSLSFALEDLPETRRLATEAMRIGTSANDPRTIGEAHYNLGREALYRADYRSARSSLNQAHENYDKCGYMHGTTSALIALGRAECFDGDFSGAYAHLSAGLELAREQQDIQSISFALRGMGEMALSDPQMGPLLSLTYCEEALQYAHEVDDKRMAALVMNLMGESARFLGQFERAAAIYEEVDSMADETGQKGIRIVAKLNLGFVNWRLGNYSESKRLFLDSLKLGQGSELQNSDLALCLLGLAGVAAAEGETQWAAEILGTIDGYTKDFLYAPTDRRDYERIWAFVKAQLTEKQFDQSYKEGQALSLVDAVQLVESQGLGEKGRHFERISKLTKREIEILRLVAQGLSDAQVAERLVLSPRTVNAHLTSVYRKIDVNSRAAATRFAIEHGLA
jgi:DNA-binding CsgD family transcriptional regulator/tetratricopeptide (TPR) repeat protein